MITINRLLIQLLKRSEVISIEAERDAKINDLLKINVYRILISFQKRLKDSDYLNEIAKVTRYKF